MLLIVSEPVVLGCSECASGHYVITGPDSATCQCGNTVTPSFDIERFLDSNERMTWVDDDIDGRILAYFTEEMEEEEDIDY